MAFTSWDLWYFFSALFLVNSTFLLSYIKVRFALPAILMVIVIFSLFIASRDPKIGSDTLNYIDFFQGGQYEIAEPFFRVLRALSPCFELNFFVISLLTGTFYFYFFKLSCKNAFVPFACFQSTFLFLNSQINIIRQGLAVAAISLGLALFCRKKYVFGILLILLACNTHYSSIIVFLATTSVILIGRVFQPIYLLLITLAAAIYLLPFEIINPNLFPKNEFLKRFTWYLTWENRNAWNIKHVFYIAIPTTLIMIFYKNLLIKSAKENLLCLLSIFCVAMLFKRDEMFTDRILYFSIPFFVVNSVVFVYRVAPRLRWPYVAFANFWLIKTAFIQLPEWFRLF